MTAVAILHLAASDDRARRDVAAAEDVEATLSELLGLTPFGSGRSLVAA